MKDYDDPAKRTGRTTRMLWRAFEVAVSTGETVYVVLLNEDDVKRGRTMLSNLIAHSYAKQFPGFMCLSKEGILHGSDIPGNLRLVSQDFSPERASRSHACHLYVDHAVIFERYHGVLRRDERDANIHKQYHQFDAQLPEILPPNYEHNLLRRWPIRQASPYPGSFVPMPMPKWNPDRGEGEEHH